MSYNYNPSVVLLIVCVVSAHISPSQSNVIPNGIQSPIERLMEGTVSDGKSDSFITDIANKLNKRTDIKDKNNKDLPIKDIHQKILDQIKKSSLEPLNLSLYGYASMVDPRSHSPQRKRHQQNPNPDFQYNSYQQLMDSMKMSGSANQFQLQQPLPYQPNSEEEALHVIKNYLKKYDVKKYFLKKILGDSYEREEGHDEGFFANKHLRRHGGAGMVGKVFGELIGIKIRKSIDNLGDTISDYAKELTTSGFVTIGNTFNKLFRLA